MKGIDLSKLPDFLMQQRWFAGKAWPIKHVEVLEHVELPGAIDGGAAATLAVVEVRYELGTPELYLLAVRPTAEGSTVGAFRDDSVARAVLQLIHDVRYLQTGSGAGALKGERFPGSDAFLRDLGPETPVRRIAAEQSNTSMVFGETVILKIIRKIEAGVNPEYEMGRYLASHGFTATPELLGALQLEGGQASTTLAVLHRFVPNATDGWAYVRERFGDWPNSAAALLPEIRELGQRLGELHRVLGKETEDPAFSPEPVLAEDLQRWSSSIIGELGVTLASVADRFPKAFDRRAALVERMKKLGQRAPEGKKIRIHGDLHLGQVLRAGGQWLIFDFEGEPLRKLAQRREKQSPLKDVAGMLRSFDYADATVTMDGRGALDRARRARQAFLEGYLQSVLGAGLVPDDPQEFAGYLDAFEVEKLLYEIRYELANRPDWARIPIEALMREEGIS